jgi:hypothetical protein
MPTLYPDAKYRPLEKTQGQSRMARHDIFCFHTMVGNLTGTDGMFKKNGWGGTESHWGVGGIWGPDKAANLDGVVYQWQDAEFRADANLNGNHRILSCETADNAPQKASDIAPWTEKQMVSNAKLAAWACKHFGIPPVLIPDSKPSRRGIGYHRLGIKHSQGIGKVKGWLVVGGEQWSTSTGKECPGDERVQQMPELIERINDIMSNHVSAPPIVKEKDMQLDDTVKLTESQARDMNLNISDPKKQFKVGQEVEVERLLVWGGPGIERIYAKLRASETREKAAAAQLKTLTSAVQALVANSPNEVKAAFNDGIAQIDRAMDEFKKELTELDVQVTVTDPKQ